MDEKTTQGIIYKEIKDLFEAKDRAINQKDKALLASTQLDTSRINIPRFTTYKTEIITIVDDDVDGIKKIVFVRELFSLDDYDESNEPIVAHQKRYKITCVINTALGWRESRYVGY